MNKKDKTKLSLNIRKEWEIGKGHNPHKGGAGEHDSRPKRARTRTDVVRRILKEENE